MKRLIYMILTVALSLCLCSCGTPEAVRVLSNGETKIQDLADTRIGVVSGSLQAVLLPQMLPDAEFTEYNSNTDVAMALEAGKIDAFSVGDSVYRTMLWEGRMSGALMSLWIQGMLACCSERILIPGCRNSSMLFWQIVSKTVCIGLSQK